METNTTTQKVLATIRDKKIGMLPRWRFVLATLGVALLALASALVSLALVNFILFTLRVNGHESLLSFGGRGVLLFLVLFPWPLLALDAGLLLLLHLLLQRFRFGYRTPMLYLFILLVVGAAALGASLDRGTHVNDRLLERADQNALPQPVGEFYEAFRMPAPHDQGVYRGIVQSVGTSSILLSHDDHDLDDDETVYRIILPDTFDISTLQVGDRVYVAGDEDEGGITAFGIRVLVR